MSFSAYQPTAAQDVVAVFDNNFNQLFISARPMKASVKETAKLMKHPVESGATISDFRIIEPIKIDLHLTVLQANYVDTYNQIKQIFLGNSTVQIQTNTGLYPNMFMGAMPHEESPDVFDTIKISLSFEEAQIASTSTSPLPASATTKSNGNISGTPASTTQTAAATQTTQQSSAAYSLFYGK